MLRLECFWRILQISLDSFMSCLHSLLGYSAGEFQALHVCWSTLWKSTFFVLFFIVSQLNALQYNTLFSFTLFSCLIVLYFLHSTSLLSFYIDLVLTLSIGNKIHVFNITFKVPYVLMSRCPATWSLSLRTSGVTVQHSTLVRAPSLVCLRNVWSRPQDLSGVMAANSR